MRFTASFLVLGLFLSSCAAPRLEPGAHVFTASDRTPIAYEAAGRGDTTVVLIHCWCGHKGFWDDAVPALAERYQVIALDLAGHGESGRERQEWTVQRLADDVVELVRAHDLERVILVGHSMGGPVSLLAAPRMPGRVLGIVAVDTLHDVEFQWPEGMIEGWLAGLAADWQGTMRQGVASMLPPDVDPALAERIAADACRTHQPAALALIRDMFALDLPGALSACGVPVRCINAAAELEIQVPTAVETNRKYADFEAREMSGVGHYPMLEKPEQFAILLLEELARLDSR